MTQETPNTTNTTFRQVNKPRNTIEVHKQQQGFCIGYSENILMKLNRRNKHKHVPPICTEKTTSGEIRPLQKNNITIQFRRGYISNEKKELGRKPKLVVLDIETSPETNTPSSESQSPSPSPSTPQEDNTNITCTVPLATFTKGSKLINKSKERRRNIEMDIEEKDLVDDQEEIENIMKAAEELKKVGNDLYIAGKLGEALEVYKEGIISLEKCEKEEFGQLKSILYANMGSVLMALGYPEKSLELYDTAFKYNPKHIKGKIRKANVLICLGEYDQAHEFLSETEKELEESHSLYEYINIKIKEIKKNKSTYEGLEIIHKELLSNYEENRARTFIMKLKEILEIQKYNQRAWSLLCTSCLSFSLLETGISNLDMMKSSLMNLKKYISENYLSSWCLWLHAQYTWQDNSLEEAIVILKKLK